MKWFLWAVFATVSLAPRLEAAASPQDDYLQIYVMINEGDKLNQGGQSSQAREKYETALNRLEKLKSENPEWEPTIVKYRIKYLNDKLSGLRAAKETAPASAPPAPAETPKAAPAPTPAPTPTASENPAPAKREAPSVAPVAPAPAAVASDDPSALRQRIIQLTGDLESARTELKQAKADLDQALVEKKGLREKLSSASPGDANVAALQQENEALRTKLASTEESLKKAAGGELGGELASLRGQVDSLEKKLAEANAKSAELTRANDDYRKQIAELTSQLQLAGTAGKSDSTLAKENVMLRSILDRQLKEQARREAARRLVLDEFKNLAVSTEALKTQMEVLSSPLIALSPEEENMLKVSPPSLQAPEPSAPTPAGGAPATLSSAAEKSASPESFAEKPRIPEEFKETAARATTLYNEKKFEEAAAAYQEILNKYPQSIYALSNLGVVRFQQQKFPEAEKALREAVRVAPNDAFSHSVLGIVLVQQEKYDDAIQILSRAVALDPNDPKTRNYLGISSSRKGLQEAAEQECRKAIELDESYGDAHFNLAVIYALQNPPAKELAKRHYNRALELGVPKDEELEKLLN